MEIPSLLDRNPLTPIHLSQSHLNLLETCPPQFQRIYLEQLASPSSPEQQEKFSWGNQFHCLMQQRELGLPIDSLLAGDPQLQQAIASLIQAVPEIQRSPREVWREAEHCRSLQLGNYLLTAIYDLLIVAENQAKILDWKTYLQPEDPTKLAQNWQTRLYLYLLAETSEFLPEQISLTYWFVKLPTTPQSLTFPYDRQQHKKNEQDLTHLLSLLDCWILPYCTENIPFPHQDRCEDECPYHTLFFQEEKLAATKLVEKENLSQFLEEIEEIAWS